MMTPKNIAHSDLVNAMSQVGQGTLDAAVPPGRVVVGHLQDERFDLIRDAAQKQKARNDPPPPLDLAAIKA